MPCDLSRLAFPLVVASSNSRRMTITQQRAYEIYGYSCHEGNIALRHTLMGERVNGPDRGR